MSDLEFAKGLHVAFEAGQVQSQADAEEVARRMVDRQSKAMVSDGLALAHWILKQQAERDALAAMSFEQLQAQVTE